MSVSVSGFTQSSTKAISKIQTEYREGILSANEAYIEMNAVYNNGAIHKCATPLHIFAHQHYSDISPSLLISMEKAKISSVASTYISPSGKFEFTYETTGDDAVPADDANSNGIPDYVEWGGRSGRFQL